MSGSEQDLRSLFGLQKRYSSHHILLRSQDFDSPHSLQVPLCFRQEAGTSLELRLMRYLAQGPKPAHLAGRWDYLQR